MLKNPPIKRRSDPPIFCEGIVEGSAEAVSRAKRAGRPLWLFCPPCEALIFARPDGTASWEDGKDATPL